ncbi:MAG: hypothetical protein Q8O55_05860 [Dehalococcoidales bacterium]|nr:hypothetical protein [Dehalococcoidales bacterium]
MTKLSWFVKTKLVTKYIAKYIAQVAAFIQGLFVGLLVTYLLLILIESLWVKSVSPYLSLNLLLIEVIITGVISVLTYHDAKQAGGEHPDKKGIIFMITTGLVGAGIIWYKTQDIGWLSYVISIASGSLIVLLLAPIWRWDGAGEIEEEDSRDN